MKKILLMMKYLFNIWQILLIASKGSNQNVYYNPDCISNMSSFVSQLEVSLNKAIYSKSSKFISKYINRREGDL